MKKELLGSKPASPGAAVLISKLIAVRMRQAALKKRATVLTKMIKDRWCGSACGYRTYVSHRAGGWKEYLAKPSEQLVLVKEKV